MTLRHRLALAVGMGVVERRQHVEEQRLAERARLLGAVEHRDALARSRAAPPTSASARERAVQPDLRHADPLAPGRAGTADRLARRLAA